MNYIQSQLDKLHTNDYDVATIVINDNNGTKTKTLDVTADSIPIIIEWLQKEHDKLTKGK